ncbi:hypothetical protein M0812_27112 [Anaeramoeba flamelloides]|uniref:ESF1 RRM domain-containing protein n=1 Tax=Anaeramoeba flamelloides TaxID=1746091 RepID=A0AAV7YHK7_9EUKA|nr:hypothetical protein M0812_27112 [Anaeramoeba flamelloides]
MSNFPKKDKRFTNVFKDPKYKRIEKRSKKKIDPRFKKLMKSSKIFQMGTKIDQYGRKLNQKIMNGNIFRSYDIESSSEESEKSDLESKTEKKQKKEQKKEQKEKEQKKEKETKKATPTKKDRIADTKQTTEKKIESQSESSDSSDTSNSSDELSNEFDDQNFSSEGEQVVYGSEKYKRFAVQNINWKQVRSVDLFALFQGFLPKTGQLNRIDIIASEYGANKMKLEDQNGPEFLQYLEEENSNEEEEEEEEEESEEEEEESEEEDKTDESEEKEEEKSQKKKKKKKKKIKEMKQKYKRLFEEEKNDELDFNEQLFREYERDTLKYYFAVVDFDSKETAYTVYKLCQGMEFEKSGNILDLRFIPDDITFTRTPRDSATSVPHNYKTPKFAKSHLDNTKINFDWDTTDKNRLHITNANNFDEYNGQDFEALIGSGSDSSSSEDSSEETVDGQTMKRKKRDKYRLLLEGISQEHNREETDVEITFTPGLREKFEGLIGEKNLEKEKKKESGWDSYKRKRKEKRKEKKMKIKSEKEEKKQQQQSFGNDSIFQDDIKIDRNDPFFAQELGMSFQPNDSRKRRHETSNATANNKGNGTKKGIDLSEKRWDKLITNPLFGLDPTIAKNTKSKITKAIQTEKKKRRLLNNKPKAKNQKGMGKKNENGNLKFLVDKIKKNESSIKKKKNNRKKHKKH